LAIAGKPARGNTSLAIPRRVTIGAKRLGNEDYRNNDS
jgi:hypothetical protein